MKNKSIRVISAALAVIIVFFSFPAVVSAENEDKKPLATLMLTSDYQNYGSIGFNYPIDNLTAICSAVSADGISPDSFILCGDLTNESGYSNYNGPYNTTVISCVNTKQIVTKAFGNDTEYHVFQGNHDPFLADLMDATGAREYEDYILYVINTEGYNPWCQGAVGAEETLKATAKALDEYLTEKIQARDTRPVIVATHVPLHFSARTSHLYGTGDNMYSRYLFDVLNRAGQYLNIVFLFGHNHSKGFDNYLGYGSIYIPCGGTILIPDSSGVTTPYTDNYTAETLNFTYMNAGYVGHVADSESEENAEETASVIEIYDNRIVIKRYSADGLYFLSGEGHFNTFVPYNDLFTVILEPTVRVIPGIFPKTDNEWILSEKIESPATVSRIPAHEHTFEKGICTLCGYKDPDYIEEKPTAKGDLNGDAKINSADVILLKKVVVGKSEAVGTADVNGDGKINSADVIYLKKIIVGKAA